MERDTRVTTANEFKDRSVYAGQQFAGKETEEKTKKK
jgi:hypothetical protein